MEQPGRVNKKKIKKFFIVTQKDKSLTIGLCIDLDKSCIAKNIS